MAKSESPGFEAKIAQGYEENPIHRCCANCEFYESDIAHMSIGLSSWTGEKNRRCGIGGFSVERTGTCNLFKVRENINE